MKFEEVSYEGVVESHIKIFVYLAYKYITTIRGFEIQDLIHEQKLACYHALDQYDKSKEIGSFLYAVSENRLKSIYRFETRLKRRPDQMLYLESASFEQAGLFLCGDQGGRDDEFYVTELRASAVVVAREVLSPFEYKLFEMTLAGDKTIIEMAHKLSKSEIQILNGITRMRRKMREKRESIEYDL